MHKHVTHTLHCKPRYIRMTIPEFSCQLICSLADNLHAFYKTEKEYRVALYLISRPSVCTLHDFIDGINYMLKAVLIAYFISHKSIFYRD